MRRILHNDGQHCHRCLDGRLPVLRLLQGALVGDGDRVSDENARLSGGDLDIAGVKLILRAGLCLQGERVHSGVRHRAGDGLCLARLLMVGGGGRRPQGLAGTAPDHYTGSHQDQKGRYDPQGPVPAAPMV